MPLFIESVVPEWINIRVSLMIALTVDVFESIRAWFTLFGFKSRRVDFEVKLTILSKIVIVFNLIWTIALDISRFLETAYECNMTPHFQQFLHWEMSRFILYYDLKTLE